MLLFLVSEGLLPQFCQFLGQSEVGAVLQVCRQVRSVATKECVLLHVDLTSEAVAACTHGTGMWQRVQMKVRSSLGHDFHCKYCVVNGDVY